VVLWVVRWFHGGATGGYYSAIWQGEKINQAPRSEMQNGQEEPPLLFALSFEQFLFHYQNAL